MFPIMKTQKDIEKELSNLVCTSQGGWKIISASFALPQIAAGVRELTCSSCLFM